MNDSDDIEPLAAEYVLGTLGADERVAVASRRVSEASLDSAIAHWEQRLGPLAETVPSIAPPEGLLDAIYARIDGRDRPAAAISDAAVNEGEWSPTSWSRPTHKPTQTACWPGTGAFIVTTSRRSSCGIRAAPDLPDMLTIPGRSNRFCDGISRRNFLRVGALGLGELALPQMICAEAASDLRPG